MTQNHIDILKDFVKKVPIREVLDHYGVKIDRTNNVHCPFHDEKHASCHVYEDTNKLFCFGKCRSNFDVIDLVRRFDGLDFSEAVEFLQRSFASKIEVQEKKVNISLFRRISVEIRQIVKNNPTELGQISRICQTMDSFADNRALVMRLYGTLVRKYK